MNGNTQTGTEICPDQYKSTPMESCAFVNELDNWTVKKDHRIYDLRKHLHPDATLLSVSWYPPVRDIHVDLEARILTANVEDMLQDPRLPNAFLCDVVVEFNGKEVSGAFVGDLGDVFYVKYPQPNRFVNGTNPNSLREKMGINLGVVNICGHQYHEWFGIY
jgi:hypothetical protein